MAPLWQGLSEVGSPVGVMAEANGALLKICASPVGRILQIASVGFSTLQVNL
jgi:hypothetical protein